MKAKYLLLVSILFSILSCNSDLKIAPSAKIEVKPRSLSKFQEIEALSAYETQMTQTPEGEIPKRKLRKLKQSLLNQQRNANLNLLWNERGPNNVAGRIRAFALDPNDPSGNTLWAGSVSGGLWKCTDFKSDNYQWEEVLSYPGNPAISEILFDPRDNKVMYVATGEGWFNSDAYAGHGIHRSTDGGETWTFLESTEQSFFTFVQKLLFVNNTLFACTRTAGVLLSFDDGETWFSSLNNTFNGFSNRAADLDLASNGSMYASMGIFGEDGIYRSDDVGLSWEYLAFPFIEFERIETAVAPSNPEKIFALVQDSEINDVKFIVRSSDGGASWDTLPAPAAFEMDNFGRTQAWYDLAIAINPANEDHIIIGGVDLLESLDGGETWNQISQWFGGGGFQFVHADQHKIEFIGEDEIIVANDGGIWYSAQRQNNIPLFESKNIDLNITQFYTAATQNSIDEIAFLAGSQDNGTQVFLDEGINNTFEITGGDGGYCFIDHDNPNFVVTSFIYNNYIITTDNYETFEFISGKEEEGFFINPTEYDHENNILYASAEEGSINIIALEDPVIDSIFFPEIGESKISALKVHPSDRETLYLGTNEGEVFRVVNINGTPTVELLLDLEFGFVRNIDFARQDASNVMFTLSNFGIESVFLSMDGGENWESIEGDLPDMPVRFGIFNPLDKTQVILATEMGVWTTNALNGDNTKWMLDNNGIPLIRVNMLRVRPTDNVLLAASYGRGLFSSNTLSVVVDEDQDGFVSTADCDDNNAAVNPAASEIPYNGIDDDCNPETRDDDLDQDGFASDVDCNDADASINPNVEEIPYNGIDDDCNLETLDDDLDQDGFTNDVDCNDMDATINPDAEEIANNDIDENCDGMDLVSSTNEVQKKKILIYPNPAAEFIQVEGIFIKAGTRFQIYDVSGKLLLQDQLNGPIDIRQLPNGLFSLRLIVDKEHLAIVKFMVMR